MKKKIDVLQLVIYIVFILLAASVIAPFMIIVSASITEEEDIIYNGFKVLPQTVSFAAYKYIFTNPQSILDAYKTTIAFSVLGTVLSTLFMAMLAYPLSSKKMRGKKVLSFYVYFTMLFSGGLVPGYILNTQYLHLDNTLWIYILPTMISPWYVFMMRSFFKDLPVSLIESMKIDGASEYRVFFTLILPLSKPIIATVALFILLLRWNDWNTAMLYIDDQSLISLQYLLQKLLRDVQFMMDNVGSVNVDLDISNIPTTTLQMAMSVLATGPALIVFPFFQKYFVRGITVGSVKG